MIDCPNKTTVSRGAMQCSLLVPYGIDLIADSPNPNCPCQTCKEQCGDDWPPRYALPPILKSIKATMDNSEIVMKLTPVCQYRGKALVPGCCPDEWECLHPEVSRENGGVAEAGKCNEKCKGFTGQHTQE